MKISKEEQALWLEDWKKSGKKAWTYARENGLIPQTFVKWAQKETENKKGFVEIHKPVFQTKQANEILIEKGELRIHIPLCISSFDLGLVMEGLRVVL